MASSKEDVFSFLQRQRNISPSVINRMKDDKIDLNVINVMTDEELSEYMPSYGDRLSLRAFCRQTFTNETESSPTSKSVLMQRIRDRLKGNSAEDASVKVAEGIKKEKRRIELGWLHFTNGEFRQVRAKNGGGTRSLTVHKDATMKEMLEMGKKLFFPGGTSSKGMLDDFDIDVRDFGSNILPLESTVVQLYDQSRLKILRIYIATQEREMSPDEEMQLEEPCSHSSPQTKTDSILLPDQPSTVLGNTNIVITLDENDDPSDIVAIAIQQSFDSEVQFGPVSSADDTLNSTVPLIDLECFLETMQEPSQPANGSTAPDNEEAQSGDDELANGGGQAHDGLLNEEAHSGHNDPALPTEKETRKIILRRVNIVEDVLEVFKDPDIFSFDLTMELVNEEALDSQGVSREVYTAFWETFLEDCEGEEERVPRLRPDYSEKEWGAIGRVWLKGYLDHDILPIRLSPAFVIAFCQEINSVNKELLMKSFLKYLSASERESVEKALHGKMDEDAQEDVVELYSRMGSHCMPSSNNLQASLLTMAHKVLLQEPKFIIDCINSSVSKHLPVALTKCSILELYESKRPSNKKVAQMLRPSNENQSPQEQAAMSFLQRYVRNLEQRKLETFLRFCTGSTVLCKDAIEVSFNKLSGLSRRPVAHTCGAFLELPCTYGSYPEFRAEFDNVLSGDCFTMDIA